VQHRPRRLSLCEPAGLETDGWVHGEQALPSTVPEQARTGRWIAGSYKTEIPAIRVFPQLVVVGASAVSVNEGIKRI
jgi:hypothetical protein